MSTSQDRSRTLPSGKPRRRWRWIPACTLLGLLAWQVLAWLTPVPAPLVTAAVVTDEIYDAFYSEEIIARAENLPPEVNILLVGLDNRLAERDNHADAIHLLTIHTKDPVEATITSIPRGTPVSGYNIAEEFSFMANVRALKGRKALMSAVAALAGKRKIDYYVEVSFSQVMGVLELLGYEDPATALQYLRHRKSYRLGDVQRSYNQGKFIRHQFLRHADMLTGAKGDLLIRMGVGMVETDLDLETVQAMIYLMRRADAVTEDRIALTMLPRINLSYLEDADIPDPDEVADVVGKLVRRSGDEDGSMGRFNPYPKLSDLVRRAEAQRSPRGVLAVLKPMYEQKSWLQVQERPRRQELRDRVETLMVKAYTDLEQPEEARLIQEYMKEERTAFKEVERRKRSFTYTTSRSRPHRPTPQPQDTVPRHLLQAVDTVTAVPVRTAPTAIPIRQTDSAGSAVTPPKAIKTVIPPADESAEPQNAAPIPVGSSASEEEPTVYNLNTSDQ